MKPPFSRLTLLALPLFALAPARAAVNPAIVSADARWIIYADLGTLRQSVIGKELITLAEKAQIDTTAGRVGVDWQKLLATIGSATAYGTNLSPEPKDIDGALLVQGTPDLRKIAESLLIQANLANPQQVVELTDLSFPAYALHEGAKGKPADAKDENETAAKDATNTKNPKTPAVVIAFPPEPVIIVSKSKPQILKARDVFRGAAPSLAKSADSPLKRFVKSGDGACLFAASAVPTEKFFKDDGPQARILKMASAGSFALGERGPDVFAHNELVASSDAMADKLMKILQGLTAMMSLAETSDKALNDFLNSAAVKRDGDMVTLDLSYSSARLAEMIKTLQQQATARGPDRPATPPIISGRAIAEWKAETSATPPPDGAPAPLATKTIEGVALKNGAIITLGRASNGGKPVRFDHIEIAPTDGSGAPLSFRPEFMRTAGPRGNWNQLQFPGADGNYTLKVVYANDPEGKATYAVSVRELKTPEPPAAPSPSPKLPEPKLK